MKRRLVAVVCAVLMTGCSTGSPSDAPSPSGSGGSSSSTLAAGQDFVVGGDRPVTVHVPRSFDPGRPAPLLIVLHGYGSSGREHEAYFRLRDAAERRGMITAYPDGTTDSTGSQYWNATDACCGFDQSGVDDSGYLLGVVAAIKAHGAVDPQRIFLIGHSNGGFMTYRMACDHAEVVAAIISLAAATFAHDADCHPSEEVSVVEIHATADKVIAFSGGSISGAAAYPGALETVKTWARYDGCGPAGSKSPKRVDVDADLSVAGDRSEATIETWSGCGHGAVVELWTMPGGVHAPTISTAFPDAALDFLLAHPKP
ncbi:prolyl oligopeptidase family serine peptidase [Kribbella sp. NBC_00382]|uniref:alpha/beta hydrolase family esterase n=1 Tax=Kribbella sp. NBC_00382 TaxID=2975967 RepID=UPI002E1C2191